MMWMAFASRLEQLLEDFRPVGELKRDRYATIAMDYQALRLLGSVALRQAARGERDIPGVSVLKLLRFGGRAERLPTRWTQRVSTGCIVQRLPRPTTLGQTFSPAVGSRVISVPLQAPSPAARRRSANIIAQRCWDCRHADSGLALIAVSRRAVDGRILTVT